MYCYLLSRDRHSFPTRRSSDLYTAIAWGVGLSHERSDIAGAESFHSLEGNMCGTAMRGADALPGSKATSRAKGSHRKLGDLGSGHRCRVGAEYDGPHREDEESKPMMHGHEKSDLAIVAGKSANNVAPRCGAIRGGVSHSGVDGAKGGDQGEWTRAMSTAVLVFETCLLNAQRYIRLQAPTTCGFDYGVAAPGS